MAIRSTRRHRLGARAAGLGIALAFALLAAAAAVRAADSPDSLARRAWTRFEAGPLEARRQSLDDMVQATLLAPGRADLWLSRGRMHALLREAREARRCFARATELSPGDAEALLELGRAWKWDWLQSLESASYQAACSTLARAAEVAPRDPAPWLEITALALVRGDAAAARDAARGAWRAQPGGALPTVATACAAYRLGLTTLADSLFDRAQARLPEELARRFEDFALLGLTKRAERESAAAAPARWWREQDPDLTTPENETRLSFAARLGHAILLFRDGDSLRWDRRTELMVRYGLPSRIEYNSLSTPKRSMGLHYVPDDTFGFPHNDQLWHYPALGMTAWVVDRSLNESYTAPIEVDREPEVTPDPAVLAARPDLVAVGDGRGVFRVLPPGQHALATRAGAARFPTSRGGRLVAHVSTPGGPADTLRGTWVVVDAAGREVAREERALSVSACDPTERRTADFAAEFPPGRYRLGFAVTDAHGGRGLSTLAVEVDDPPEALALSDVVVLCGDPGTATAAPGVRIEPDLDRRAGSHANLGVYFEVVGLTPDRSGLARFAYTYRIRSARHGPTAVAAPWLEATREESQPGSLRRQLLSIPIGSLPVGNHVLEIEVRDLNAGAVVTAQVDFARLASADGPARR